MSGIIGAIALNLIDRFIAKKLKSINESQQFAKRNELLATTSTLVEVAKVKTDKTKETAFTNMAERHREAADVARGVVEQINENESRSKEIKASNAKSLDDINNMLNNL